MENLVAISDVITALINVGTIDKTYESTTAFTGDPLTGTGTITGGNGNTGRGTVPFHFIISAGTDATSLTLTKVYASGPQPPQVGQVVGYDANFVVLEFNASGGVPTYEVIAAPGAITALDTNKIVPTDIGISGSYTAPCFVEGTRIRTTRGEVAVEDLTEGDLVLVHNDTQDARPVAWIGHREVNLAVLPDPFMAQPIRIRRDAFGPDMPSRDLLVSPDHAVHVDHRGISGGVLIQARLLVNGATILRETHLRKVRYYHVELDRHAVLFSENLPTESYLDTGNRAFFQNGTGVIGMAASVSGDPAAIDRESHCCRPFVYAPASVRPVWERLAARATELGHALPRLVTTTDADPRIEANGQVIEPLRIQDGRRTYVLPPQTQEVRLISRAARPCDTRPWLEDHRTLGVSVSRIRIGTGQDTQDIAIDGPALARGWSIVEYEADGLSRWTHGDALIRLPEGDGSSRVLEITMGGAMVYALPETDADAAVRQVA